MSVFGKIELSWILEEKFRGGLPQNQAGAGIAFLKTLLVIASRSEFNERTCKISYSELEELTGLSRPKVAKSLKMLIEKKLISVLKAKPGIKTTYKLEDNPDEKGWGKAPRKSIENNLRLMSNRKRNTLAALKVFLVILKNRDSSTDKARVSHEKIREITGIQTDQVRTSIDILLNFEFISFNRIYEEGKYKHSPIDYKITGIWQ